MGQGTAFALPWMKPRFCTSFLPGGAGTRVEAPVCLGDLCPLALRYVDAHTCGHKAAFSSSSRILLPLDGADGPCYRHFNGLNYSNNHHGR